MFDSAETPAVAAARKSSEGELNNDEKQVIKTDLIVLKGGFSTGDHRYNFEIKSDGTGEICYSDFETDSEDFTHEIKVEKLAAEIEETVQEQIALQSEKDGLEDFEVESIRREISAGILEEVFWNDINQTLEDPFFQSVYDDGERGEEFQTIRGTVEEFTEFLELCVLTEREIISGIEDYLFVEAETEIDAAGIGECSYYTERLAELVEIACRYYKPTGFHYDYNDGCYDRMSGYSMSSETISISLAEFTRVPSREKMLGMIGLRKKLAAMDVESEKLERLTSF